MTRFKEIKDYTDEDHELIAQYQHEILVLLNIETELGKRGVRYWEG